MIFLADMGISPLTVEWLERQGHDAVHLLERGAAQARDPDILQWAREEDRILLTHDLDFSELVAASQGDLPSVIVFRLRDMTPDSVNEHLARVLTRHPQPLEKGAIFSVQEGRIRWRSIPFEGRDD
jgi:predicted nuclease of predicted toxin-antitoxin system